MIFLAATPPRTPHFRRRSVARGLTLLELTICLLVSAALVGGLASAVRLATQSLDGSTSVTNTTLETCEALDRLNAELRLATKLTERTATAVTFTIPDQTGDGIPDTVRYAWGGAGTALTRTVNGLPSPAADVLTNVQAFNLSFLTRTVQPPIIESATQVITSYTAAQNATGPIMKTAWEGESFRPTFAANAVSWKINGADIRARRTSSSGTITVSVYAIDATNKPTGTALTSANVSVSSLPSSFGWVNVALPPISLSPTAGAALVVSSTNSTAQSELTGVIPVSPATVGMYYVPTTTQGSTWDTPDNKIALNFRIYGTISTMGP